MWSGGGGIWGLALLMITVDKKQESDKYTGIAQMFHGIAQDSEFFCFPASGGGSIKFIFYNNF